MSDDILKNAGFRAKKTRKTKHRGYRLMSGKRVLGSIVPTTTRGIFSWSSNFTKDKGVTPDIGLAIGILLREAGMSKRQYEIDLVDAETGKRRPVK